MTQTDLAYIAGLIDGEGCIRVKKSNPYKCQGRVTPGFHPTIQIRMVDEPALKFISECLGGWYYKEDSRTSQGRPLFCYQATDKKAEYILRSLLPFLRVKKDAAKNVLALCDLKADGKNHKTKLVGYKTFPHSKTGQIITTRTFCYSDEFIAQCNTIYMRGKELNHTGI